MAASLRYVAALGPAFAMNDGSTRTGTLAVETTDPDDAFIVEVGDHVAVRAADEARWPPTSPSPARRRPGRGAEPARAARPAGAAEGRWLLAGLATTFDQAPS